MKLLLHTCCAPCSLTVAKGFEEAGAEVTSFFYNPNIHPYTEYKARLDSLKEFSSSNPTRKLMVSDKYDMENFFRRVASDPGDRCRHCYRMRLEETAGTAMEHGYDSFSTTLLVSPYQNSDHIKDLGHEVADTYGIGYVHKDFRDTFREGQSMAKELGLYRQKYCGCIYSELERYLKRKAE